jgi:glucose/mannose-6-phosphate isomerase
MVLDTLDMFGAAAGLADQAAASADLARGVAGLEDLRGPTNVVVLGLGGSGIGGDVAASVLLPELPVPMYVAKTYHCPGFVGENSLVVASSFSGNTEETITAAHEARARGARMVVLAHGGQLAQLANEWGVPHLPIPEGIPMPRAGIAAVSIPLLVLLERVGLASGIDSQIEATVTQLRRRIAELSRPDSAAARLARRIGRTLPLVYGEVGMGEAAAWRWKGQFNENAKVPSWCNRVPELTHNEICGWAQHGDVTRQVFTLIQLRHDFEHPRNSLRMSLVAELSEEIVHEVHDVHAQGDGRLAQLFDLIVQGDYVSLELAAQSAVDPGPIPILDDIKTAVAGHSD